MTQAGQLGTPLGYDLVYVSIHPDRFGDDQYNGLWNQFCAMAEFEWIFGAHARFLRLPVALMPMRLEPPMPRQENDNVPQILQQIAVHSPIPRWVNMTTPERQARRIQSTESFRAEINLPQGGWTDPNTFSFYVCMWGILYNGIM